MPPGGLPGGASGVLNLLYVLVLGQVAELEARYGDRFLAERAAHGRDVTARAARRHFFAASEGLFADDLEHAEFSEHAQILALLAGLAEDGGRGLFDPPRPLTPASDYFSHYYFECCGLAGRMDRFWERFERLRANAAAGGGLTTPEGSADGRSDCHAWSCGALFHAYATVAGVRPGSSGFGTVEIRPQLGPLARIEGELPHPDGRIAFAFARAADGTVAARVELPEGARGTLHIDGERRELGR